MAFVVFEGIDGAGKTSLITQLSNYLNQKSIAHVVTREPGGSTLGDEIRELLIRTKGEAPVPRAELLLYEAVRAQHVETLIRPTLNKKAWVLCDRYAASSLAFQSGGRKIQSSEINWLNNFATDKLTPDCTILLDLSVEESTRRRKKREFETKQDADRFESEQNDFHQRVRDSYLNQARDNNNQWLVLDATKTPQQLFDALMAHLKEKKWLKS